MAGKKGVGRKMKAARALIDLGVTPLEALTRAGFKYPNRELERHADILSPLVVDPIAKLRSIVDEGEDTSDVQAQIGACEALLEHAPDRKGVRAVVVYGTDHAVRNATFVERPIEAVLAPGDHVDESGKTHRQAAEERLSQIVISGKNAAVVRAARAMLKRTLQTQVEHGPATVIVFRGVDVVPDGSFVLRSTSAHEREGARAFERESARMADSTQVHHTQTSR